jgi:hypothetical protein
LFALKGLGGQAPKGDRVTPRERIITEELLKTLPVSVLSDSIKVLESAFEAKKVSKDNSKSYKSAYKSFIDWLQINNYDNLKNESIEEAMTSETKSFLFKRNPPASGRKTKDNYHGGSRKEPYTLMGKYGGAGAKCGQLIYPEDYVNQYLLNEIDMFTKFRYQNHNCTKATVEKDIRQIYPILGWLHRYKKVGLDELSLESIIHFIKLNIPVSEAIDSKGKYNYHKHILKKAIARQKAIDLANEDKNIIQQYFDFLGGHSNTKIIIMTTCIAIAKFLFRNELGTDDYIDESDLPIVRRLNQLSNLLNKKAKSELPKVSHESKSVSWQEAVSILENFRQRANATMSDGNKIRNKNSIIHDLQRFLLLAFMLLIPVDRSRTYYELEIGRTFVYGINENGRFTPAAKMKDNCTARWYIHLMPEDYKTGKSYKEYWGIMPNVEFLDGTKLYEYIDKWLNDGREYKHKCNHNFFFRSLQNYEKFNSKNLSKCLRNIFAHATGIPVTPKELRKMYVTYLNNQQATNAELKAAAKAMHHSTQMQEKIYNSQHILDSIAPIYALNERMHEEFFGNSESD